MTEKAERLDIDSQEIQEDGGLEGLNVISGFLCGFENKQKAKNILGKHQCKCGHIGTPSCHCFYDYE